MNAKKYDWVLGKTWYYRKNFTVPGDIKDRYVFLCFDGIDYYARIWLNGRDLGRHEGLQGGPMLEVGSLLKTDGPNELVVEVRAANHGMGEKFIVGGLTPTPPGDKVVAPWGLPGGNDLMTGGNGSNKKILPERKMSIEDYFPMGIWRPVRLEIVPRTHLARPFLSTEQAELDDGPGCTSMWKSTPRRRASDAKLNDVPGYDPAYDQMGRYRNAFTSNRVGLPPTLRFQLLDRLTSRPVLTRDIPLQIYEGRNWVRQQIDVPSPKLWWPNGMGDPYLYRVSLSLMQQGKPIDTVAFDYGIRTLRTVPSAGPKTGDRWTNWQFMVNDRKFFVHGMDWWTNDVFLDLPRDRYRWALESAKAAGIQLWRTWGGGIIETDDFYELCDQLGILVWEDFPIANRPTDSTDPLMPHWPQDIWEEQVLLNIFRIRNHPSLALYSGGNEFWPYIPPTTADIGVLERSVIDFDGTRPFLRATPDRGDIHAYPKVDPTWFSHLFPLVPYISEFGPHSVPEARAIREFVDPQELEGPLRNINSQEFVDSHPEFIYHYLEYDRLIDRRFINNTDMLLARASQILDMKAPSLEEYSLAGQVSTGEFIQTVSDFMQSNYPVSTGLSPWVYNTPWPLSTPLHVCGL